MKNLLRAVSFVTILTAFTTPLIAQDSKEFRRASVFALPGGLLAAQGNSRAAATYQRDSLWNGALVGAGLGAMAGAAVGIRQDDGCRGCAGFNAALTYGVISAGIGAGIGAGIDALFHRRGAFPTASRQKRGGR